jgi:nucleotide-binding universal stress UspA family protein
MVIVAAVDRDDGETDVVRQAWSLADRLDQELHLVHCLSRSELRDIERTNYEQTGESVDMSEIKEIAASVARDAAADVPGDVRTVGLVGAAAEEILDYVADVDPEYLVIGGRKQSPVGKVIFGSTTQSILLNADRPVLTVMGDS